MTPEVWSRVFKAHAIRCRPVLGPRGSELRSVVQLVIDKEVDLLMKGRSCRRCRKCRRLRHAPVARGEFPPIAGKPRAGLVRSTELFGSGHAAWRCLLMSHEITCDLLGAGVRGALLRPVQSPRAPPFAAVPRRTGTRPSARAGYRGRRNSV